jgi:hypothetical protein
MTHLVRLEDVQLFPRRQVVDIRPISVEAAEVTQRVRPESTRQVGTAEKVPNVFFANSPPPLSHFGYVYMKPEALEQYHAVFFFVCKAKRAKVWECRVITTEMVL